jgi:uncharacterized protein
MKSSRAGREKRAVVCRELLVKLRLGILAIAVFTHAGAAFAQVEGGRPPASSEAVMTPWWHEQRKVALHFLSVEETVLEQLEAELGLRANVLRRGYFPDLDHELAALDFSDFVVLVHADMPEDLVYLLTWCFTQTRGRLEQRYRHVPPARAALSYPLIPQKMAASPIPLHAGAERLYREQGYLTSQ